jgi:hypothetical protein
MPYEGEFASYEPLRRVADSERIERLLKRSKVRDTSQGISSLPQVAFADVRPSKWQPDIVIAVDGNDTPIRIENGYPGAEMAYITVASVFLDLLKVRMLDEDRPVDPKEFRKTEKAEAIDSAFPGCNVVVDDEASAKSSLRKILYELMNDVRVFSDGESLLDTYETLLKYRPDEQQNCPHHGLYDNDCADPHHLFICKSGQYQCHCQYAHPLYSTDALRVHEGMRPDSSNGAMFAEIRQVLERLWVVHILRNLESKGWLATLRSIAVVLDGPLAVFGHPAWLSHTISQELIRINEAAKEFTDGQDLLLIGIEKSGAFVNHFAEIAVDKDGQEAIPSQVACLLTDDYIKRNIVYSESDRLYGRQTYFGRKLFYKTASGALIVATLPFLNDWHRDLRQAEPSQYPRLADAMALLDQLVSSRYPHSLAPIVSAHAEAAIPLNLGIRVLEDMARKLMRGNFS